MTERRTWYWYSSCYSVGTLLAPFAAELHSFPDTSHRNQFQMSSCIEQLTMHPSPYSVYCYDIYIRAVVVKQFPLRWSREILKRSIGAYLLCVCVHVFLQIISVMINWISWYNSLIALPPSRPLKLQLYGVGKLAVNQSNTTWPNKWIPGFWAFDFHLLLYC